MSGDQTSQLIYALLILMLVASALFARRLPMRQMAKYALIWAALFAIGFVLFSFRGAFKAGWTAVRAELTPWGNVQSNGTVTLKRDEGGHFSASVEMNGVEVSMLVDSGATVTSISADTARKTGITVDRSAFPVVVQTANGTSQAWRATADTFSVSGIERPDFAVHVSDTLGDADLLGMNFLSTLKSWRVEGETMILEP